MASHAIRPLEIFSQLYIGDYFSDTLELSAADHSAFRLLLIHLWLTDLSLAQGDEFATAAGLSVAGWKIARSNIAPLLWLAAANIHSWKAALLAFDGQRLPPEYWRVARAVVLERDGYTCVYCGSQERLHVDHRTPVSQGGSNTFDNLATSCSPCNLSKASKSPAQWRRLPADTLPTAPKIWENGRPYQTGRGSQVKDTAVPIQSAGLLLYRRRSHGLEIFLIHMGGPLWANKDALAWSIPKGVISQGEDLLAAAKREFAEETGFHLDGQYTPLGTFRQNGRKDLTVWALENDCDPKALKSNVFSMIWPPKSGQLREFPEADRADWFAHQDAMAKIVKGQQKVLERFFERTEKQ